MTAAVDDYVLTQLPLAAIERVTFYKRDEITSDLICCEVEIAGEVWTFHEELQGWDRLVQHLGNLPNFRKNWFAAVSQPAFQESRTVAFKRN